MSGCGGNCEKKKGLIMVYTGNGKGKTTAAIGQAVRALGHGYRIFIIHLMKGRDYGEYLALQGVPGIYILKSGRDEFVNRENPENIDIQMAREGFNKAKEAINSGEYDLVIMDEINVVMDFSLIPVDEVLEVLNNRPSHVDVILTGRYAPAAIIEKADLVSEVKEVKHHYQAGVQLRQGIEY